MLGAEMSNFWTITNRTTAYLELEYIMHNELGKVLFRLLISSGYIYLWRVAGGNIKDKLPHGKFI